MTGKPPVAPRTGRARRFDPDTERELLLDATLRALRRNDYEDVLITDILDEAGLSTRSFYRHFGSKDELLLMLYRRDADAAAARLRERVEGAGTPAAALELWIDEIMSFRRDRRKAERVSLMGSPSARRAAGYDTESRHAGKLLAAPLFEVLEAGRRDGSFPAAEPLVDTELILAIVFDQAGLNAAGTRRVGRVTSTRDVVGFCLRALGAGPGTATP